MEPILTPSPNLADTDRITTPVPLSASRLQSLDVFRGMTIAFMLLVNNPGSWDDIYPPLEHAAWNGCTPTDLVYPSFLFMIGVSTVFSLSRARQNAVTPDKLLLKIIRRGLILFLIGLFLSLFPHFEFKTVRIMGVLQRIALVYTASSLLFVYLSRKQLLYTAGILLAGYYILMVVAPLLLTGSYSLAPGESVSALIDRAILTNIHMWKPAKTWDPEGLTGTFPAIVSAIIGIMAGMVLYTKEISGERKVIRLFTTAFFLIVAGMLVSLFFPINKSLWTSSFVLYAGGIAMAILTMFYYFIDIRGYTKGWTVLKVFGMNAIAAFAFAGLVPRIVTLFPVSQSKGLPVTLTQVLYESLHTFMAAKNASLAFAVVNVAFYFCLLGILYRRKIFIRI